MILDYAEVATIVPVIPKVRHLEVAGATVHEHRVKLARTCRVHLVLGLPMLLKRHCRGH